MKDMLKIIALSILTGFLIIGCDINPDNKNDTPIDEDGIRVVILPSSFTAARGSTVSFLVEVKGSDNQKVDWSIESKRAEGTGFADGEAGIMLNVDKDETNSLLIRATPQADPEKYGEVLLNILAPNIGDVKVLLASGAVEPWLGTVHVKPGGQEEFFADTGDIFYYEVIWSIVETGLDAAIDAEGKLSLGNTPPETSFTVRAVSTVDESKSGTATVLVREPTVTSLRLEPSSATIQLGGGIPLKVTAMGTGTSDTSVDWKIKRIRTEPFTYWEESDLITIPPDEIWDDEDEIWITVPSEEDGRPPVNENTRIDDGMFNVAINEATGTIRVTAVSKVNPEAAASIIVTIIYPGIAPPEPPSIN